MTYAEAEIRTAAVAVSLGADTRCGLDYLALSDDDREVARQVLEALVELTEDKHKSLAAWIARYTWGDGDKGEG